MNEEMNNNEEPKVEVNTTEEVQVTVAPIESLDEPETVTPEPTEVAPVETLVEPETVTQESTEVAPVEPTPETTPEPTAEQPAPEAPVPETPTPTPEPKQKNKTLPIIIGAVVLIAIGLCVAFGMGLFGSSDNKEANTANNEENGNTEVTGDAEKFEGIYATENDKMFIRKESGTTFHYMIGGSFEGSAVVNGDTAKEKNTMDDDYFTFKLTEEGIELTYNASEDKSVIIDTGLYKKVADYNVDNKYKEAVGDPQYLETGYNGVYKTDEITLYVFQISENDVLVKASNDVDVLFDEKFTKEVNEVNGETSYVAKSFFDEEKDAFILNIFDNSIEIIVKDDVLDYNEDDKKLENNYKFDRKITKEEIIEEFYSSY